MTNPYAQADMAHDSNLVEFDLKRDAYERDFELLKNRLIDSANLMRIHPDGYIDIIEKAAADIIDLHHGDA